MDNVDEYSSVNYNSDGKVPELVGIDYPANVVNVDKMMATLGGSHQISEVYSDSKRRLELRFRPGDIYCKPVCGDRTATTSLLIKVKRRIKRRKIKRSSSISAPSTSSKTSSNSDGINASAQIDTGNLKDHDCSTSTANITTNGNFEAPSCSSSTVSGALNATTTTTSSIELTSKTAAAASSSNINTNNNSSSSKDLNNSATKTTDSTRTSSSSTNCSENAQSSEGKVSMHSTLLGFVNTTYEFNTLCDYQYLPTDLLMDDGSKQTLPYSCFTPTKMESLSWLHETPQCLFLPPAAFSRMDSPQHFFFRGDGSESFIKQDTKASNNNKGNFAGSQSSTGNSSRTKAGTSAACGGNKINATAGTDAEGSSISSTIACSNAATTSSTGNSSTLMPSPAPNVICRTRHRRTLFAIFRNYHEPTPEAPEPQAIEQLNLKFLQCSITPIYKNLKKLFEERPIWSKNALKVALGNSTDNLKYLLPTVAYYFSTGPWRNLWVKFAYDPRKDNSSFKYQTIDYRMKQTGRLKSHIEAKRSYRNYTLPYKSTSASKRKVSVIQSDLLINSCIQIHDLSSVDATSQQQTSSTGGDDLQTADEAPQKKIKKDVEEESELGDGDDEPIPEELRDAISVFTPGTIPPYRQMFYQYIDIRVPEIKNVLLEAVVSMKSHQKCDERYGWLSKGVEDECRKIIASLIDEAIDKKTENEKEAATVVTE